MKSWISIFRLLVQYYCLTDRITGIGTDATIAQHIQTIQDRNYATKNNNQFAPTTLGVALVAGYNAMGLALSKPQLRAAMVRFRVLFTLSNLIQEADMKQISLGNKTKQQVLDEHIEQAKRNFQQVRHTFSVDSQSA